MPLGPLDGRRGFLVHAGPCGLAALPAGDEPEPVGRREQPQKLSPRLGGGLVRDRQVYGDVVVVIAEQGREPSGGELRCDRGGTFLG